MTEDTTKAATTKIFSTPDALPVSHDDDDDSMAQAVAAVLEEGDHTNNHGVSTTPKKSHSAPNTPIGASKPSVAANNYAPLPSSLTLDDNSSQATVEAAQERLLQYFVLRFAPLSSVSKNNNSNDSSTASVERVWNTTTSTAVDDLYRRAYCDWDALVDLYLDEAATVHLSLSTKQSWRQAFRTAVKDPLKQSGNSTTQSHYFATPMHLYMACRVARNTNPSGYDKSRKSQTAMVSFLRSAIRLPPSFDEIRQQMGKRDSIVLHNTLARQMLNSEGVPPHSWDVERAIYCLLRDYYYYYFFHDKSKKDTERAGMTFLDYLVVDELLQWSDFAKVLEVFIQAARRSNCAPNVPPPFPTNLWKVAFDETKIKLQALGYQTPIQYCLFLVNHKITKEVASQVQQQRQASTNTVVRTGPQTQFVYPIQPNNYMNATPQYGAPWPTPFNYYSPPGYQYPASSGRPVMPTGRPTGPVTTTTAATKTTKQSKTAAKKSAETRKTAATKATPTKTTTPTTPSDAAASPDTSRLTRSAKRKAEEEQTKSPQKRSTGGNSNTKIWEGPPTSNLPGSFTWPDGWLEAKFQRQAGETTGRVDLYWFSPIKKFKFRSRTEVVRFLTLLQQHNGDEVMARKVLRDMSKSTPRKEKASAATTATAL